jgi:hypothetical protein
MRIIIIAVLLSLSVPGWAAFRTGNTLMELVPGYKSVSGKGAAGATDYMSATDLRSYIAGVHDGLEGFNLFCSPNKTNTRQITYIVILYLESHPEEWSLPANEIITTALIEAFPCSQEKPGIKEDGGN